MEEQRPKKLPDQVRDAIRLKHYSIPIEQAYVGWIKRYILIPRRAPPGRNGRRRSRSILDPFSPH